MRMNLPVTDSERHLADGDSVVSRTNTRGIITYVNTTFCEVSGYTQEELIGQPHNIVRHPDMPAAVFADLWATLKAGTAWQGLIKNRCKDGGFYWVEANANPIFVEGEIVGYMSLRTRPTAEQVRHAQQVYANLHDATAPARWRLRRGRCVRNGWRGLVERMCHPQVRDRIAVIIITLALSGLLAAGSALSGMASSNHALALAHRSHLVPSQQLSTIIRKMMENRIFVMQAVAQPTPEAIAACKRQILANQRDIGGLIAAYRAAIVSAEQQQLVDSWNDTRLRYKASIDTVMQLLDQGDPEGRAASVAYHELPLLYEPVVASASALLQQHLDAGTGEFRNAQASHSRHRLFAVLVMLASAAMAAWLGITLSRAILRPLRDARQLASAISSGDLTSRSIVRSEDEIGEVVQSTLNIGGNLRGLTHDVVVAGDATADAAFRIAADAQQIGLHMLEQRQAVARIAGQASVLRENMASLLDHALTTRNAAIDVCEQTSRSRATLHQVIHSIDDVQQATNRIGDIVAVMASIATHTDVLALNAAENTRTGEQQRALPQIVAEIRSLARRSHSASGGARQLMTGIIASLDRGAASLDDCRARLEAVTEESAQVVHLMTSSIQDAQAHANSAAVVDSELAELTRIADQGAALSMRTMERAALLRASAEQLLDRMSFFTLPARVRVNATATLPDSASMSATTAGIAGTRA